MRDVHDTLARELSARVLSDDDSGVISLVHHMRRTGLEVRLRPEPADVPVLAAVGDCDELSPAA